MSDLGNRNPDDPTGEISKAFDAIGYQFDRIERTRGGFIAHAHRDLPNGQAAGAAALGRTPIDAARSLVKSILRP